MTDAWPIGIGHPCFGCTEQKLAFRVALHDDGRHRAAGPARHLSRRSTPSRATSARSPPASPALVGGALLGAGLMAARKLGETPPGETKDSGKEG